MEVKINSGKEMVDQLTDLHEQLVIAIRTQNWKLVDRACIRMQALACPCGTKIIQEHTHKGETTSKPAPETACKPAPTELHFPLAEDTPNSTKSGASRSYSPERQKPNVQTGNSSSSKAPPWRGSTEDLDTPRSAKDDGEPQIEAVISYAFNSGTNMYLVRLSKPTDDGQEVWYPDNQIKGFDAEKKAARDARVGSFEEAQRLEQGMQQRIEDAAAQIEWSDDEDAGASGAPPASVTPSKPQTSWGSMLPTAEKTANPHGKAQGNYGRAKSTPGASSTASTNSSAYASPPSQAAALPGPTHGKGGYQHPPPGYHTPHSAHSAGHHTPHGYSPHQAHNPSFHMPQQAPPPQQQHRAPPLPAGYAHPTMQAAHHQGHRTMAPGHYQQMPRQVQVHPQSRMPPQHHHHHHHHHHQHRQQLQRQHSHQHHHHHHHQLQRQHSHQHQQHHPQHPQQHQQQQIPRPVVVMARGKGHRGPPPQPVQRFNPY